MDLSDSSWQYFPDTIRITGVYIICYKCGPIYYGIHVPEPVSILIHGLLNKHLDIVPEEALLIIVDIKSYVCMDNN